MMKRLWLSFFGLAFVAAVVAQAQAPRTLEMQGRIVSTGTEQFVLQTRDNKQLTFYTNPQTKFVMDNRAARFTDLRAGSDITAVYVMDGTRYMANTVTFAAAAPPPQPANPPAAQPANPPAPGTLVEGQVVRVVGQDQVVIKTADGKEVIVFVNPQTTYQFNDRTGQWTDIRPGIHIGIYYDERDRRFIARRIFNRLR